jgi:UDP-N-acetylglucosamine 1-carboxyvinyltransferase
MAYYRISGGKQLSGEVHVSTAKNSAVACLIGSVMTEGVVTLKNVPRIEEVARIMELLRSIGVVCRWKGQSVVTVDASGPLSLEAIDKDACIRTRSSLLLFGALARFGKAYKVYRSGGCKLGKRTIRPHLFALEKLGLSIESHDDYISVKKSKLAAADITMYESSDTSTENVILASVCAPGTTTVRLASANYMVQDLCHFLNCLGADIQGIGTTTLTIHGVSSLRSSASYSIAADPIDAMAWISIAAATNSELTIVGAPIDFLRLELEKLRVMGLDVVLSEQRRSPNNHFELVDIRVKKSKLSALPDKLSCRPFPGLNIDNLPLFLPILIVAKGRTLVHDWVYEDRVIYATELKKLGAQVELVDTHRVFAQGPSALVGADLMCPPALRPAMMVLITMLSAKGESILRDPYQIERGYENIVARLSAVGAHITREDE